MEARRQDPSTSIGLLLLRVAFGAYMAAHGWGKLQMLLAGDFAGFGDPIGLGPHASLVLVTMAEFGCALLVLLGLWTRYAAAPIVFAMGVAALVVHGSDPWTSGGGAELFFSGKSKMWSSKEPALLYLAAFLALMWTGSGRYALDAWRPRRGRRA
jgi:putative oxidoreductase